MLRDIEVLLIDAEVALVWAQLRVSLAEAGRKINFTICGSPRRAARHGVPVVSQDDDFEAVDGMSGVVVLRV